MEKSKDDSPEKPDKHIQENGITNDKAEETCSKVPPNHVGKSDNSRVDSTSQPVEDATRSFNDEGLCSLSPEEIKQIVANFLGTITAESSNKGPSEELRPSIENIRTSSNGKEPADHAIKEFTPDESSKYKSWFSRLSSGKKTKTSAKMSRSKSSRSDSRNNKTLQSRGGSAIPEPNTDAENSNSAAHASSSKERRMKKKKKLRGNADDIFIKIRKQVRYILNKIKYEQSLIDAYGGEGWKGLSIDKLKPEKELQRADSEILRCKLRLRDLFQRLDTLCAEGSFPRMMFDSEGLLDSEDIYCTICGSKDLSADNDIVLCDGDCNRAFHQLCLKPPLLTEEIPPDDQGWLCPGCDCKFDCTELLNDFFETDLSTKDNWTVIDFSLLVVSPLKKFHSSYLGLSLLLMQNVFPEAATAADGASIQDEILRLPSDDSEDDDFDPNNMDVDKKIEVEKSWEGGASSEGEESTSDESDFTSDSEDLDDFLTKEQVDGNPPDNSEEEDDEYDPDVPEPDEQNKEESSSSDFTSDSDDFAATVDNVTSKINGDSVELLAALETEHESSAPGSKKRDSKRLDYKKLYDETYENASSESSDDEEWTEAGPSRKRKNKNERDGSTFPKKNIRASEDDEQSTDAERKLQKTENGTPGSGKKLKSGSESGSMAKGSRKILGETATQKLSEAFQKSQYPERAVKENLAKELGISYQKVDKWFGNARWSFNHPLHARTVSKCDVATKAPSQATSDSKTAMINNSSNNHSSQKVPDAKTTVDDNPVKSLNPTRTKAAGERHQSKKLSSPNSSATDTTIQGDASKSPPSQSNKRRSARLQETCASISSRVEANKVSTNNAKGPVNAGESGRQKATTSTPNLKQRGKKELPSSKKTPCAASKEVVAQRGSSTAVESSRQNESISPKSRKRSTKFKACSAPASTKTGSAAPKRVIQTRSRT